MQGKVVLSASDQRLLISLIADGQEQMELQLRSLSVQDAQHKGMQMRAEALRRLSVMVQEADGVTLGFGECA